MENGGGGGNLESKFAGLVVSDSSNSDALLHQVVRAVDAAEVTIKQQVEENNRLRSELQKKITELEKYKAVERHAQSSGSGDQWDDNVNGPHRVHQSMSNMGNQTEGMRNMENNVEKNLSNPTEGHSSYEAANGTFHVLSGVQASSDHPGFSQFSSPSTMFSPSRYHVEGESDRWLNVSGQGLMPLAEVNNPNSVKQDFVLKIREHEEEILLLRKRLAEYSMKEAQVLNEKYVLEKRIAYMRMAFDQQQQDLVDAASKAISYRQDIIEENIRLTYALQAAQQERTTFVSSLMPLLAEYSFQPPVADAQSIVSNVKVLFRHLQEQLHVTEAKIKDSQHQLEPWHSDVNLSNFAQLPAHSSGIKDGLELVPQLVYSNEKAPSPSDPMATGWDRLGSNQSGLGIGVSKFVDHDGVGKYTTHESRNTASQDIPGQLLVNQNDSHLRHSKEETNSKQVTFSDFMNTEMDDSDMERIQNGRDSSANSPPKSSPCPTPQDDAGYYSNLPPLAEELSSSFSEAADDDPLPAIEGLQISGEAYPGRELQACGYSINGTTNCNFEWVRHLEDGSVNYIDGAKQPTYLVTADDVDTRLSIEIQPLDNRMRKGELVKVFANEHRKITCDPEMQNHIETTFYSGNASYRVSVSTGFLNIWEPAILSIKRDGYSIKYTGSNEVIVNEKFSPSTIVSIPFGDPSEFVIIDSRGVERLLRAENSSEDISCTRDTIVLILRLFIRKAGEKKKQRKRGLFFK